MASSQNFSARFAKLKFRGQVAKREGPGAVGRKPQNRMAVEKAGSAETGVRGRRYQNTRLIYVGFVEKVSEVIPSQMEFLWFGSYQSLFALGASFGGQLGTEWPFKMVGLLKIDGINRKPKVCWKIIKLNRKSIGLHNKSIEFNRKSNRTSLAFVIPDPHLVDCK